MEKIVSFDIAICRLLQEYPLYNYRTRTGKTYRLPILLIGSGKHLDALRSMVLSNGQLLDTELVVTVVTENAKAALDALHADAPDLKRFLKIQGNEAPVEMACGTLRFENQASLCDSLPAILDKYSECRYVLISDDSITDLSEEIHATPGRVIAWTKKWDRPSKNTDDCAIHLRSPASAVFSPERDDKSMAELLDIAYRLHYAYEKGNDPYITNQEIRESFKDPYNYLSNIECALHVRSKLVSAGIDPTARNSAPEEFAKKMAEDARNDGNLLERLAQLEHKRWCVSKAFAKRCCDGDTVKAVYGDDGSTTRSTGSSKKWHIALMPYGKDGKLCRRLTEQDWLVENPETITDLDALDMQTLRVHRHCAEISAGKLQCALELMEQMKKEMDASPRAHINQMMAAAKKMLKCNREAVFTYRHHRRNLQAQLSTEEAKALSALNALLPADKYKAVESALEELKILDSGDLSGILRTQLTDDEYSASEDMRNALERLLRILKILNYLDKDMGAPIEYLTRKDYKKQNLVIVGSIPFAMCGWKSTVLVKLMAESIHENVAAAWQLEPGRIVFVDTAETLEDVKQLSRTARQIDRFLSRNCNQVTASYHIFVPEKTKCRQDDGGFFLLQDLKSIDPSFFDSSDWNLYHCPSLDAEDLRARFVDLMYEYHTTSIDMTGGKPILISLADGYARNNRAGAFFIRDNRIRNFCGARGMEQQALDKGLSVQQLFDQTDAELIKRDDDHLSDDFSKHYEDLWNIAHRHADHWYRFCLCFAKAYRDKNGGPDLNEHLRVPDDLLQQYFSDKFRVAGKDRVLKPRFEAIMKDLQDNKLLTYDKDGGFYRAACEEIIACLRNSGKVLEYYIYCTARYSGSFKDVAMSWMFRHNDEIGAAKNELDVICTDHDNKSLFISAKNVSPDSLGKNNFLNYVCYEVGWLADRFGGASPYTVLAAPNVPQFSKGKYSDLVDKAMKRGVYLLGDRCFEPGNLGKALDNIRAGREDWCEFLLGQAVPAGG